MIYMLLMYLLLTIEDRIAERLVTNPTGEKYVGRSVALLLDDNPRIREAVKRYVVREGLMYRYQATLLDDGFGAAVRGLEIAREVYRGWKERNLDVVEIRR